MTTTYITTNDGVRLAYEQSGAAGPPVVLIHGWSGSRAESTSSTTSQHLQRSARSMHTISASTAESPAHGFHIARLAADLHDFLESLDLNGVTVVGTSMGCAVIWSYVEIFGVQRLKRAVFVDQAPLQNRAPDWELGSKGCYDVATLTNLQQQLVNDLGSIADGNAAGCLSLPLPEATLQVLKQETLRCNPRALGAVMADHTQLDWRPVLPLVKIPCLNLVGGQSGVFPVEGCLCIQQLVPDCCSVVFQRANHWLYLEQPDEFNRLVLNFVEKGNSDRPKQGVVE